MPGNRAPPTPLKLELPCPADKNTARGAPESGAVQPGEGPELLLSSPSASSLPWPPHDFSRLDPRGPGHMSRGFFRSTAVVGITTLLSRITGLVRDVVYATIIPAVFMEA